MVCASKRMTDDDWKHRNGASIDLGGCSVWRCLRSYKCTINYTWGEVKLSGTFKAVPLKIGTASALRKRKGIKTEKCQNKSRDRWSIASVSVSASVGSASAHWIPVARGYVWTQGRKTSHQGEMLRSQGPSNSDQKRQAPVEQAPIHHAMFNYAVVMAVATELSSLSNREQREKYRSTSTNQTKPNHPRSQLTVALLKFQVVLQIGS